MNAACNWKVTIQNLDHNYNSGQNFWESFAFELTAIAIMKNKLSFFSEMPSTRLKLLFLDETKHVEPLLINMVSCRG